MNNLCFDAVRFGPLSPVAETGADSSTSQRPCCESHPLDQLNAIWAKFNNTHEQILVAHIFGTNNVELSFSRSQ